MQSGVLLSVVAAALALYLALTWHCTSPLCVHTTGEIDVVVADLAATVGHVVAAAWCLLTAVVHVALLPFRISASLLQPGGAALYHNRVIFITGASSGIGSEIAYEAARRGATLILTARRADKLKAVAAQCRALGAPHVDAIVADMALDTDIHRTLDDAVAAHGRIDELILNAGIGGPWSRVDELRNASAFRAVMDVNYWGCVTAAMHSLPTLKHARGRLVVVSSMYAKIAPPFQASYGGSKHALHGFFDVLRQEVRTAGVSVTLHAPGGVDTEVTSKFSSGAGAPATLALPAAFMAPADACARSVLFAADARVDTAYYPTYSQALAFARNIDAAWFDWAFHALVAFYLNAGVIELRTGGV